MISRISAIAVACYAVAAGVRKLADNDIWWPLASGRWMAEHRQILRHEVFSHTALAVPWAYPIGGPIIFYSLWRGGGFTLLSLLAPAACLLVALILLRKGGTLRAWATALAIPAIAWRCTVRADLFTTVLAVSFLALLWEDHLQEESAGRRLWMLPLLMLLWVNLHPGFMIGVALVTIFALRHPRRLVPVAAATLLATLANPWGWGIYRWLSSLLAMLPIPQFAQTLSQNRFIGEFQPTPASFAIFGDSLRWRDPDGSLWWLAGLTLGAVVFALFRRQGMGPLLLVAAAICALHASRFQAIFATFAALLVPDLLARVKPRWSPVFAVILLLLVGVRIGDLVTNRQYLTHRGSVSFGTGVSEWFPERAARFIEDRKLPRDIYNDYNLGGYLTWAAPNHPVFIDGRGDPYGASLNQMARLPNQSPQTAPWRDAIQKWNLRTFVISLGRYGSSGERFIQNFCRSEPFRMVYLDETAAVFVSAGDTDLPTLDCRKLRLTPPPSTAPKWNRYQFYANAGWLYRQLERIGEADDALQQALAIFDGDADLHIAMGELRDTEALPAEAEQEFRRALQLRPNAEAWFALGGLLARLGREDEAEDALRQAAARDPNPHKDWTALAQTAMAAGRFELALDSANRALQTNLYQGRYAELNMESVGRDQALRGAIRLALHQPQQAVEDLEQALRIAGQSEDGENAKQVRLYLARAYVAAGRSDDARRVMK